MLASEMDTAMRRDVMRDRKTSNRSIAITRDCDFSETMLQRGVFNEAAQRFNV
jgi:hypothetical protein